MRKVAIDIGYNSTKFFSNGGAIKGQFPSVTGTPDKARYKFAGSDPKEIVIDGTTWFYGDDAVTLSRVVQRREDRNWIITPEYYRLFLSALKELGVSGDAIVVTGLPIAYYDDKEKLAQLVHREHKYDDIVVNVVNTRVIPQPFGAVLNMALDFDGNISDASIATGTIGVIDCGGKTTNMLVVSKMSEIARKTSSVNIGGWDTVRNVRIMLMDKFPELDVRDHEIASIIINKSVKVFGKEYDLSSEIDTIIAPYAYQIADTATQLWGNGAELDAIIIVGGGAYMYGNILQQAFVHAHCSNDPVYENVMGYYKLAQRIKE
ncbi:MAG: ParM/StbA family protein [Fervidobacterium sp.]|uniref:ParM/StbA family protein n=1 Tax=Fervidobacterium sp. TaxID=1871331 RepID=UPI0025C15511|nr:ParM/StbA family protein [Fervidobacterium sp.]NPU90213.1 ParM/StbA family protein [Fervidobacterium sp.]